MVATTLRVAAGVGWQCRESANGMCDERHNKGEHERGIAFGNASGAESASVWGETAMVAERVVGGAHTSV